MVVTTIYITRHGFRAHYTLSPTTGIYSSLILSPTRIPSDPPLTSYGGEQSLQLANALARINDPPIRQVYSSPFYRCLQTVEPFVKKVEGMKIRGDNGLGEWYSLAPFSHPHPASPPILHALFPSYSLTYVSSLIPSYSTSSPLSTPHAATLGGESPSQLHTRVATALSRIISYADIESGEEEVAILVCTHAATMIAAGRVLTGVMPRDINEPDFRTFTCGLSKFVRRSRREGGGEGGSALEATESAGDGMLSNAAWTNGKGVAGGWDCLLDSDCTHLPGGEERGWHFSGDETIGDVEQDWIESQKNDSLTREKTRGEANLVKL